MVNYKKLFGTISVFVLLVSCSSKQIENNETPKVETPKALQDGGLEIKSYSRSGDLTEELYQELVDKTPTLKKLEDELDAFTAKPNNLNDKFNQYDNKSNNYYRSVKYKESAITDSALRTKIISLITASSKKYANKTAELIALLKQISKDGTRLNDHRTVLKIVLTLPLIEKYQDENKPDKKEFKNLIKEQEQLILRTDSLTPKY
jgi:predicted transcriptional regulator